MTEDEREEKIKPLLTPDFLETLCKIARTYGWFGDFEEISHFVEWAHKIIDPETNRENLNLEPYDDSAAPD